MFLVFAFYPISYGCWENAVNVPFLQGRWPPVSYYVSVLLMPDFTKIVPTYVIDFMKGAAMSHITLADCGIAAA